MPGRRGTQETSNGRDRDLETSFPHHPELWAALSHPKPLLMASEVRLFPPQAHNCRVSESPQGAQSAHRLGVCPSDSESQSKCKLLFLSRESSK